MASQHVIELDNETEDIDKSEDASIHRFDLTASDIDIKEDPQSIFQFMRKYDQGKLVIDPDFQRNLVWSREQKSRFIESVLLNYPLPPIYVNQNLEGNFVIIDGLQRTTALHQYLNDQYSLKDLEVLTDLNGKYFSDLGELRTNIEDKKLNLYILKPSVPLVVIYDLFNRINTGGTPLNRQEIRNCLFTGKATSLLKELAEDEVFKVAIDQGISPKRMKDREAVLRYIAFRVQSYEDYAGDMSDFLESAMKKINQTTNNKIDEIKSDFKRVMKITTSFFGPENFRMPTDQTRGAINLAILESVGYFFSIQTDPFLHKNKTQIRRNFKILLANAEYFHSVKFSTGTKSRVLSRFRKAQEILKENCT